MSDVAATAEKAAEAEGTSQAAAETGAGAAAAGTATGPDGGGASQAPAEQGAGADGSAAKGTGTIADAIDGKTLETPPAESPWGADWREKLAGGDKALLATLRRYKSPENYVKAGFDAQQRIRAGEVKKPLAPNASPEEVAEWREANGVPAEPKGYVDKIELPAGVVIGEADKPLIEDYAAWAHASNMPQADFDRNLAWYYDFQEKQLAAQAASDDATWQATRDELRDEWGGADFRRNQNAINNFIATLPDGIGERLLTARGPDGRKLGADPGVLRWMASLANEANPVASVLPPGTTQPSKAAAAELADIKALMADDRSEYWQGPKASALQARYRELSEAVERQQRRG